MIVAQILFLLGAVSAPIVQRAPAAAFSPACAGAESRALDFWIGEWTVDWTTADGRAGRAESVVLREHGGCVIREHFRDLAGGLEGTGIYSYFAPIRGWSQTWMDNQGVTIHSTGGPSSEPNQRFQLRLTRGPDPNMQYRTVWEDVTPAGFTWRFQTRAGDSGDWVDQGVSRYRPRRDGGGS